MPLRYPQARIAVLCKAPEPGKVKTRLAQKVGVALATDLHRHMAWRCLQMLSQAQLARLELWCAPDPEHLFFQQCQRELGVRLMPQGAGDLGDRMNRAFLQPNAGSTVVIGTDCPALNAGYVAQALERLNQGAETVVGPAEDGGYVLLGLREPVPALTRRLFCDMPWGTEKVLKETVRRLEGKLELLPILWDVDRYPDLLRLKREASTLALGPDFTKLLASIHVRTVSPIG
ncbi:MAG: glycosyltransferase [Gammaproteobacteria bacterium]|nr:glycosyltransferase [Gammaproteobacteria bacterium]